MSPPTSNPLDVSQPVLYTALQDRNVLLTGAASGFGAAAARMFAEHGANLVIADINEDNGRAVEKTLLAETKARVKFVPVDVSSWQSQVALLREALAFFPRNEVDIYVPSAGVLGPPTVVNAADPAELDDLGNVPADFFPQCISVNLESVYVGTLLTLRYGMGLHKARKEGETSPPKTVVLIDSLAGYCGAEASVSYTCSKFGIRGFMRGIRKQAATLGVRVNSVCPFYVHTPMTDHLIPTFNSLGIPVATLDHVLEAIARVATDETAYGRAIGIMPEGLFDLGDDSKGLQSGKQFSTEGLGEHWSVLINGAMSDEIAG